MLYLSFGLFTEIQLGLNLEVNLYTVTWHIQGRIPFSGITVGMRHHLSMVSGQYEGSWAC